MIHEFLFIPLFAAAEDFLQFLVPLVFFGVWAINQLLANARQRRPVPRPRPAPPRPGPAAGGAKPAAGRQPAGPADFRDEIEAFLRRATEQKGEVVERAPAAKRPKHQAPVAKPVRQPASQAAEVKKIERPHEVRREPLAEAVDHKFDKEKQDFEQRAGKMGAALAEADAARLRHQRQTFEHAVGDLAEQKRLGDTLRLTETQDAPVPAPLARDLLAAFQNPTKLRNAILLREILERPVNRW